MPRRHLPANLLPPSPPQPPQPPPKRKYVSNESEENSENKHKNKVPRRRVQKEPRGARAGAAAPTFSSYTPFTLFTSEIVLAFVRQGDIDFDSDGVECVWKQNDERSDAWVVKNMPDMCKKKDFNTYIKKDMREPNVDYMYIFNQHTQKMTALMVVNRGECGAYPTFWTLQLLCGTKGTKDARTLLGLYCFALKHIGQPIGLLELASNYNNLQAYCLYTKFGFMEPFKTTPPFDWQDCDAFSSLPLIAVMDTLTYPDLFTVVHGGRSPLFTNKLCDDTPRAEQQEYITRLLLPQWRAHQYDKYYFKKRFFKHDTPEGEDSNF